MTVTYETERRVAVDAVVKACRLCRAVQAALVSEETLAKKDRSPVTVADFGAQALVSADLAEAFPQDPLVAEEDAAQLREPANVELKERVVQHVRSIRPDLDDTQTLAAIDRGTYGGGAQGRYWALDPIDGTKGFLRGDQYAVALALLEEGEVVVGVLGCPNLPLDWAQPDGPKGCLFVAVRGQGAVMRPIDGADEREIAVSDVTDPVAASFCESVESAHSAHDDSAKVAKILGVQAAPTRIDSQCKYAAVARGDASIYLRLPTRKDYEERIWDHAAGSLVVTEAGGRVSDVYGRALDFSLGRTLRNNKGVVATNGRVHDPVIAAIGEVVGQGG
ncbi:MAG TPA: 3'(2'),5'-bisphosphate nucleotidase [Phycisphaerae bacterium]|nr:3'(2'),5'-bisphosphate nucleotidase [Phycisphaerae bacterium]